MRSQYLNEHCLWTEKCLSKSKNENYGFENYCQTKTTLKEIPFYSIKIFSKNLSSPGKEKVNEIFLSITKAKTADLVKKKTKFQKNIIVISVLILGILLFILMIKFIRQKNICPFKKTFLTLLKKKNQDKVRTSISENLFSVNLNSNANQNKRAENVYVNNLAVRESSSENKGQIYFVNAGQISSGLILDSCSISIQDSISEMQLSTNCRIKSNKLIHNRQDFDINIEKGNFIITTENEEFHFENNLVVS